MKIRSLHKNLDTVFVDVPSLLRYLRQKDFIGLVRIDIRDYRAEIVFGGGRVRMREFDHLSGMIKDNGGTLERLLNRAKQPGGLINIYEEVKAVESEWQEIEHEDILDLGGPHVKEMTDEAVIRVEDTAPKIPKPVETIFTAPVENGNGKTLNGFHLDMPAEKPANGNGHGNGKNGGFDPGQREYDPFKVSHAQIEVNEGPAHIPQNKTFLSGLEWEELTSTTSALLNAADSILRTANLGFTDAFNKASVEVSAEFPFMHPTEGIFRYAEGTIILKEEVDPALLVSGVSECFRRIMNKLVSNPKFFLLYKQITQQIHILVRQRQAQFDKFGYTKKLEGIIRF